MTSYVDEVHISEDGGIIKKMIKAGEGGDCPTKGQEVTVNYEGRLEDGTVFDRSADHGEPLKIRIGEGQVIAGWDQGIMAMKLGEKADLFIKSKYGYGDQGSPPKIPGGATLVFTVELIQIADRRPTRWQMSDPELIKVALRQKDDGNLKFKEKKMKEAEGLYRDAIAHLDTCKIENDETKKLKITLYQNLSVALNFSGDYSETITMCSLAIALDEKAVKAHYLRGIANMKKQNFDDATADLKTAIKLSPADKKLRAEFETLKAEKKKHNAGQQAAMAKFFSEGVYNEKEVKLTPDVFKKLPDFKQENVQTFFDIEIGNDGEEKEKGRVVFEVFSKQVPKTAENFRVICTGEKGEDYFYKFNMFHRVIKGFMAQGGDITAGNGTGGHSIYGEKFEDEQIWYPHTSKGVLSMANAGPNTNGSQFFLCFGATPHLNEKHTIFGRVISGYDFVDKIENNPTGAQDKPLKAVTIIDCGELKGDNKLNEEQAENLAMYIENDDTDGEGDEDLVDQNAQEEEEACATQKCAGNDCC